jgi:hypothetical protein
LSSAGAWRRLRASGSATIRFRWVASQIPNGAARPPVLPGGLAHFPFRVTATRPEIFPKILTPSDAGLRLSPRRREYTGVPTPEGVPWAVPNSRSPPDSSPPAFCWQSGGYSGAGTSARTAATATGPEVEQAENPTPGGLHNYALMQSCGLWRKSAAKSAPPLDFRCCRVMIGISVRCASSSPRQGCCPMTSLFQIQQTAEQGDVTEVMLASVRLWLETYYPGAKYAVVVAELGKDTPSVKIPVLTPDPACDPCVATGG